MDLMLLIVWLEYAVGNILRPTLHSSNWGRTLEQWAAVAIQAAAVARHHRPATYGTMSSKLLIWQRLGRLECYAPNCLNALALYVTLNSVLLKFKFA